jgi:glycerate 2-kinase
VRVLAAPDKFRGTLSAAEAAAAMVNGAAAAGLQCSALPLADGGEGMLDVLGGPNRTMTVTGPLGAAVEASWRLDGTTAYVEMARASGLVLVGGAGANAPTEASSIGTGELIAAAVAEGADNVVVGVGGSATTDGGWGALEALAELVPFPTHGITVHVACDVTTRFVDAASVFAPQKGATDNQVTQLERRLVTLVDEYRRRFGRDVSGLDGAGAAGGLAGGLAAAGATLETGFDLVARLVRLDEALATVDLVLTGEGQLDRTSFAGKVVGGLARRCAPRGIELLVVAGTIAPGVPESPAYASLADRFGLEAAIGQTAACVTTLTTELLSAHKARASEHA